MLTKTILRKERAGELQALQTALLSIVTPNSRVLDIGCGKGERAAFLHEELGCAVTGIAKDSTNAEHAAKVCKEVITANPVSVADFSEELDGNPYELVLLEGTLEQSPDPTTFLQELLPYVQERILVSVHNVAYCGLIMNLARDAFEYKEQGVLDPSKIRLFTRSSLIDLLESSGYQVERIFRERIALPDSEFSTSAEAASLTLGQLLKENPDGNVYRYMVLARPFVRPQLQPATTPKSNLAHLDTSSSIQIETLRKQVADLSRELSQKTKSLEWLTTRHREEISIFHRKTKELSIVQAELAQLRKYTPEVLPKPLRWIVKAFILLCSSGPFAVFRTFRSGHSPHEKPHRDFGKTPRIEILTLAYNSQRFIDKYFQALSKLNYPHEKLRINVLDNASADNSAQYIRENYVENDLYPIEVRLFESDKNLGFTGGNNFLLKKLQEEVDSPLYFLLNHDTEIDPDCISRVLETMSDHNDIGMVEARQEPREHPKYYNPETGETSWCSGGGVLIAADALREVGLFDDRFFLYCEDVDLSWRMWLHGWRCLINPEACYRHETEDLDEEKDLSNQKFYMLRNAFLMRYKYASLREIYRFERDFSRAIDFEGNAAYRDVFIRARKQGRRFFLGALSDNVKNALSPQSPWVKFHGFDYEERRKFVDTTDGRRIFFS